MFEIDQKARRLSKEEKEQYINEGYVTGLPVFSEDAVIIVHDALDVWVDNGKINDFSIVASHEESLHPWNAIAVSVGGHGILD